MKTHTQRIIEWLQSEPGQAALEQTRLQFPQASIFYSGLIGYALGKHGHQFSDSYFRQVDFDEVSQAIFGETDKERIYREVGAKGGKPRGETPSRATIYRDREKERKANEKDR
jgi:hypothetical protein